MKQLIDLIAWTFDRDRLYCVILVLVALVLALLLGIFAPLPAKDISPSGYPYDRQVYGFNLTSGFNAKRDYGAHGAWDIALPQGTPLKAMMDGVVNFHYQCKAGMYASITNGAYEVQYMHLSKAELRNLKDGRIEKGQVVAYSGTSGESTGPHVHVVILWFGKPVNPDPYFKELI